MSSHRLAPGKLPADLLSALLGRDVIRDPRVLVGPGIGRDAAVIEFGDRLLVAKTDPITFAADEIGWYAVQVNANDVAAMGARPQWFLAAALLPERGATAALAERIHAEILEACEALGVALVGGHTEITIGLDRPIVVGQMLGEATREELIRPGMARPGDALLLTKGLAVEGVALLARECSERVTREAGPEFAARCRAFLRAPGISVVRDARCACAAGGVRALHDPTEGGLATALRELAEASGCGLRVREEAIPVYLETRRLCALFGLDPLGLLASGALLIAADPARAAAVAAAVRAGGVDCARIGELTPPERGCRLIRGVEEMELPRFERDEIARVFSG